MVVSKTVRRHRNALLGLVVVTPFLLAIPVLGGSWTLKPALKQIDMATKGVRGLAGEVSVVDVQRGDKVLEMAGRVAIREDGRMRIDLAGEKPRTILRIPNKMFVHEPARSTVVEYPLAKHPEKLAQYAITGFAPSGSRLEKTYLLTLVGEKELDGRSVLLLELTPKSEELRAAVSKIQLWIDQANWLPLQQRIFHSGVETHLTLRYSGLSRNDGLDKGLFAPKWPKGTRKEKRK
jgi:outer membrane lipoprotein-sorting protein